MYNVHEFNYNYCSTIKELLNATFSLEFGRFQHKLWTIEVSYQ